MKDMSSAPKDGTPILVYNVENYLNEGEEVGEWLIVCWEDDWVSYPGSKAIKRWCAIHTWQDEQGGHYTADNPIGWFSLPEKI